METANQIIKLLRFVEVPEGLEKIKENCDKEMKKFKVVKHESIRI